MADFFSVLKQVPLFADLPDVDLLQLCGSVEEIHLQAGETLFTEGSLGQKAYVIKEGQIEIFKNLGDRSIQLAVRIPGEVIGEMALLEAAPRSASGRALTPSTLLAIHHDDLDHLLQTNPNAAHIMLHTVTARLKSTELLLKQSEKMAELGTLTAGIAHELNNPAAAARRGSDQLNLAWGKLLKIQVQFYSIHFSNAELKALGELFDEVQNRAVHPAQLDAIQRSDIQAELEEWLEGHGVEDAWDAAPQLAALGYDPAQINAFAARFPPASLPLLASWIAAYGTAVSLLFEIGEGARRISEIVKALKAYVYLDQAPAQEVDVAEGLENTLVILRHKLQGVDVRREYDPQLPRIQAYGSELNQVWTNLIDNAIDAVEGQGVVTLRTHYQAPWVIVEVEDTGAGIPPELLSKLFNPFFTTKPQGEGTGLGLNTSYNIIHKHKGDIKVHSQPGQTRFEVWLPVNPG